MTAVEYHQLIMAAQTIALCVLAVALMFLGFVLWHVATALRRLQATRLAVVQIEALDERRGVAAAEAAASGVVPLRVQRQRVMGGYPPSTPPPPGDLRRSEPQPPSTIPPRQR